MAVRRYRLQDSTLRHLRLRLRHRLHVDSGVGAALPHRHTRRQYGSVPDEKEHHRRKLLHLDLAAGCQHPQFIDTPVEDIRRAFLLLRAGR